MKRIIKMFAVVCTLSMLLGVPMISDVYAYSVFDEVKVIDSIDNLPEGMSYDEATDTLTLDNYIGNTPINARAISENLTIKLIGDNHIRGNTDIEINGLIAAYNLNITGPGTLSLELTDGTSDDVYGKYGIYIVENLNIEESTINIISTLNKDVAYLYGIGKDMTVSIGEININNSTINITNTLTYESDTINIGIDAEGADLNVIDSNISIRNVGCLAQGFYVGCGFVRDRGSFNIKNSYIYFESMGEDTVTDAYGEVYPNFGYMRATSGFEDHYIYVTENFETTQMSYREAFDVDETGEIYDDWPSIRGKYRNTYISATPRINECEHIWDEGTVTKEADCVSEGSVTYTCSECGETKTEVIAVLGHSYSAWEEVKAATTTEEGVREAVCSRCGEKITETIPKLTADDSTNVKVEETQTNTTSNSAVSTESSKKAPKTGDESSLISLLGVVVAGGAIVYLKGKKVIFK